MFADCLDDGNLIDYDIQNAIDACNTIECTKNKTFTAEDNKDTEINNIESDSIKYFQVDVENENVSPKLTQTLMDRDFSRSVFALKSDEIISTMMDQTLRIDKLFTDLNSDLYVLLAFSFALIFS